MSILERTVASNPSSLISFGAAIEYPVLLAWSMWSPTLVIRQPSTAANLATTPVQSTVSGLVNLLFGSVASGPGSPDGHPPRIAPQPNLSSDWQITEPAATKEGWCHRRVCAEIDFCQPVAEHMTSQQRKGNRMKQKDTTKRRAIPALRTYKTKEDFLRWLREKNARTKLAEQEQPARTERAISHALMVWADDGGAKG